MKKKVKRIIAMVLSMLILFNGLGTNSVAAEKETKKVEIYNAKGQYIGEYESFEEFTNQYAGVKSTEKEARGIGTVILHISAIYGVISMIIDAAYVFNGVDVKQWVRENVVIPFYDSSKEMYLRSVSGGITNPYPPNSQQYAHFNSTNYYWEVM